VNSKELCPPSTKHKVVLIGDSNTKGYVHKLESLLNNNYELYSIIKPGATTNELKETATEEVSRLSCNDVMCVFAHSYPETKKKKKIEFSFTVH